MIVAALSNKTALIRGPFLFKSKRIYILQHPGLVPAGHFSEEQHCSVFVSFFWFLLFTLFLSAAKELSAKAAAMTNKTAIFISSDLN